ncbi:polysaccharide pyruvyl transferase family protein [Clostridium frigoris]|nr:polysaccharide pyruvyl transferase family protein [Clostridium frigoris]
MKEKIFLLYANGSSENHGCEAIRRSLIDILSLDKENAVITTTSISTEQKYKLTDLVENFEFEYDRKLGSVFIFLNKVTNKLIGKKFILGKYKFGEFIEYITKTKIAISSGGDNYCYGYNDWLVKQNQIALDKGCKLVLYGCSMDKRSLGIEEVVKDLKQFSLIIVRESLSYDNLVTAGIVKNIKLYPDPAFALNFNNLKISSEFSNNNTIGINISPMIINNEQKKGICLLNYKTLIKHIIVKTKMQIALIPHVVWNTNDDRKPLRELYNEFKDTGRVVFIEDHNCMELKGYISRCRMFVGARTHATIAAYSTCVPTLVVGYSVKAKGIAKDIFGTYENYVIPVQAFTNEDNLTKSFQWIFDHENEIRTHLQEFMPSYIEKAWQAGEEVKKLIES